MIIMYYKKIQILQDNSPSYNQENNQDTFALWKSKD